ncbi:hypothetical protein F4677DRAFT_304351 [Hypoxylon crocopeplum]|nr:hypothetical protein F4677DRAFT_304351 [Hypoxylon crocopeplum]
MHGSGLCRYLRDPVYQFSFKQAKTRILPTNVPTPIAINNIRLVKMSLTFSHISADNFEHESQLKAGRKRPRKREAVSCFQCRTKKIRCERTDALPCKQCQVRGINCTSNRTANLQSLSENRSPKPPKEDVGASGPRQLRTPSDTSSSERGPSSPTMDAQGLVPAHGTSNTFSGSERKTRMISVTHWMAPCNDMLVVKALLDRSDRFQTSRVKFAELKILIRIHNAIPVSIPADTIDEDRIRNLLPDQSTCNELILRYRRIYGRIYDVIDTDDLSADLNQVYMGTVESNPVRLLRTILVVAIAMQDSEADRLTGRKLAQQVEDCVRTSRRFQKPCIGVVQVFLLLLVMKTIMASDTDSMFDSLGILGFTNQIVFSMGLHRDPALFVNVSPYYAEVRKRLWGCYLRLNLDYCMRSGTQLVLRLEDCDCPLPSPKSLRKVALGASYQSSDLEADRQAEADAAFGLAALKLAKIIAPIHQTLCSPNPCLSANLQTDLQTAFRDLLSTIPRPGSPIASQIDELQQSMISISMHSFLLIIALVSISGTPSDISQQALLLEMWNYGSSILHQFQNLCQDTSEVKLAAFHLLWTHAGRAALISCVILGRLRTIDLDRAIAVHPNHTVSVFSELLSESLSFMLQLWNERFYHGAVAAKTSLLLAVCHAVTSNLYTEYDGTYMKQKLFDKAVLAAEELISDMTMKLYQRQARYLIDSSVALLESPNGNISTEARCLELSGSNMDNLVPGFNTDSSSTCPWSNFDLSPDFIQLQDPLTMAFTDDLSIDIAF